MLLIGNRCTTSCDNLDVDDNWPRCGALMQKLYYDQSEPHKTEDIEEQDRGPCIG